MNLFGSAWQVTERESTILEHKTMMLQPAQIKDNATGESDFMGSPYPFGIDPVWQISTNKIVFLNSFKMKISIIIGVIHMVLFKDNEPDSPECEAYMYAGQAGIQKFLVIIAVVCIPWMLLAKPLITKNKPKAPGEETDFTEIMILQGIHTIEYVLGTVSHTASYLRLWALSLAHAQLSEVLWGMIMRIGLSSEHWSGGIILWAIFAAWAVLTVGILCLMEGLSAFLHTLRLHWVEFQSKFYSGNGYLFIPFSFENILKLAEDME